MAEAQKSDDMVKLVNISKNAHGVTYTYGGQSEVVKDFRVVSRVEANHAVSKSYVPENVNEDGKKIPSHYLLDIEELPEGQRSKAVLSKAAEEVNVLKGEMGSLSKRNGELEGINKDLLEEVSRLRARIAKLEKK